MNAPSQSVGPIFNWVLQTTWQAAVLAGLILLVQWLFRKRLSPAWRYGLWLLLVARLLMPASPKTVFSVFNLSPIQPKATDTRSIQPLPRSIPPIPEGRVPGAPDSRKVGLAELAPPKSLDGPPSTLPASEAFEQTKPATTLVEASAPVLARPPLHPLYWSEVAFWVWLAGAVLLGARLAWMTDDCFLSATLTVIPPGDGQTPSGAPAWSGALKVPAVEIPKW